MSDIIKHTFDLETIEPEQARFQLYTPTKDEERPFRDALGYLAFKWQFFSSLIYSGMRIVYARDLPSCAATDGHSIFLRPELFEPMDIKTVPEKVFVLGHEVSHRVLNHCVLNVVWRKTRQVLLSNGSWLPYDHDCMNVAEDYGINAMLNHSGVGRMPKCALYNPKLSQTGMESSVEIYEKLYRDSPSKRPSKPGDGKAGGSNPGVSEHGGFDTHLEPSEAQIKKDEGKREQEIVSAGQLAQRTQGSIPGALQRVIDELVDPKVPWGKYLRTAMQRKCGSPKLDWKHRDRRLAGRTPDPMYYAKRGHIGAGTIVCIGDNSGSIGDVETTAFASEMGGIVADLNPMKFVVIWCDAKVTRVDEVEEPMDIVELFTKWRKDGVGGGGGTDFRPAFDKIEELGLEPDMLVFFTDGYGTFPAQQPVYPVIWASITKKGVTYPWGEVVEIDV